MKTYPGHLGPLSVAPAAYRSKKSSALVIVLGCLVIITLLIVAFFASVSTERQSSKLYANSSSVKLLADSAVSIVMGQIINATMGTDASGNTLAWASQPGMIRTYNTSGQPSGYYKLYSWANMIGSGAFTPTSATETVPTTWTNSLAYYTDLNDPVSGVYPIVDPAATNFVQGFSITGAPASTTDAAPMPVQWLYVLQSGQVIAPDSSGSGNTATFTSSSVQPSATNPIVARIAFWADDDTSKVNINTACGDVWTSSANPPAAGSPGNPGSFWDIPRYTGAFERTNLGINQPAEFEFQRYPGHPATTYLSAVFTNLTEYEIDNYLNPRTGPGGSQGGAALATTNVVPNAERLYSSVDELMFSTNVTSGTRGSNPPSPFTPLTASQIEQAKFFLTAHSRAPEVNLYNEPRIVIWPHNSQTNTASNTYRTAYDNLIAYCGTLSTNNYVYYFQRSNCSSATNDLPATATPLPGLGRNRQLITYLRALTSQPVPGFSTNSESFVTKYPVDRDQILTEIFDYVRALNAQDTSWTGSPPFVPFTPAGANGTREGQIIPITDTDRLPADYADNNTNSATRGFGRFPTVREATLLFAGVGQTQSTNNPPNTTNYCMPLTDALLLPAPSQGNVNSSNDIPIADGNTRVQAAFLLNFFDPSQGYGQSVPDYEVSVSWPNGGFTAGGKSLWTATTAGPVTITKNISSTIYGGYKGASSFVMGSGYLNNFISTWFDAPTGGTFAFTGGTAIVKIISVANGATLQTLNIYFPSATFPVPKIAPLLMDPGDPPNEPAMTNDYRNFTTTNSSTNFPPTSGRFSGIASSGNSDVSRIWVCGQDVVRSVEANTDPRLIAAMVNVPTNLFSEPEPAYSGASTTTNLQVHSFNEALNGGGEYPSVGSYLGKFVANINYGQTTPIPSLGYDFTYPYGTNVFYNQYPTNIYLQPVARPPAGAGVPDIQSGGDDPAAFGMSGGNCVAANGVYAGTNATAAIGSTLPNPPGDWDTGFGEVPDGAYINKADEGTVYSASAKNPYFNGSVATYVNAGTTFFSPSRQMPSAVMFGSLPTGVITNHPWQTLLFRPDPGGTPQHVGAQSPCDYLLLDLFNMPIVEPYAISDPFSTAGKINMNYQIVPFTYITRSTGIQAVLKPEQILTLANTDAWQTSSLNGYKVASGVFTPNPSHPMRNFLDLNQTLTGFQNMFTTELTAGTGNTPDIFRSASQICSIWLVPQGQTYNGMQNFWTGTAANNYLLTGDNVRERPYANIYPRLTTKSNTFTVHYRVQMLKKVAATSASQWVEGTDVTTAEYRGSSTIERYLDPNGNIPDYAGTPPITSGQAIDNYYKFRVIETKQFTP